VKAAYDEITKELTDATNKAKSNLGSLTSSYTATSASTTNAVLAASTQLIDLEDGEENALAMMNDLELRKNAAFSNLGSFASTVLAAATKGAGDQAGNLSSLSDLVGTLKGQTEQLYAYTKVGAADVLKAADDAGKGAGMIDEITSKVAAFTKVIAENAAKGDTKRVGEETAKAFTDLRAAVGKASTSLSATLGSLATKYPTAAANYQNAVAATTSSTATTTSATATTSAATTTSSVAATTSSVATTTSSVATTTSSAAETTGSTASVTVVQPNNLFADPIVLTETATATSSATSTSSATEAVETASAAVTTASATEAATTASPTVPVEDTALADNDAAADNALSRLSQLVAKMGSLPQAGDQSEAQGRLGSAINKIAGLVGQLDSLGESAPGDAQKAANHLARFLDSQDKKISGYSRDVDDAVAKGDGQEIAMQVGGAYGHLIHDFEDQAGKLEQKVAEIGKKTGIAVNSSGENLNPAGFAPPGLNKRQSGGPSLKEGKGKKLGWNWAPPAPPAPTSSGTTTQTTSSTTAPPPPTTSSTTTTTSSTGGNININISGTGTTSSTAGTGGSGSTGGTGGYTGGTGTMSGVPMAGTAQTEADFGIITINGVTTYLGSVQAPYMTTGQASEYIAGAINTNSQNTVKASVDQSGVLTLSSKDGSSPITINRVGVSTTGDPNQLVNLGLQAGTYGSSIQTAPSSHYFADTFDQIYQAVASGSMTAPAMNNTAYMPTSTSGAVTSAQTASATAVATASATAATQQAAYTASRTAVASNPIAGYTNINEPVTVNSLTDFGKMTINGKSYNLGSVQTINQTRESAAQYLASVFNVQGGGSLTAQAIGSQLVLNSSNAGEMLSIQSMSPTLDLMDPQNRYGFAGFSVGQFGSGSLIGGNIIL